MSVANAQLIPTSVHPFVLLRAMVLQLATSTIQSNHHPKVQFAPHPNLRQLTYKASSPQHERCWSELLCDNTGFVSPEIPQHLDHHLDPDHLRFLGKGHGLGKLNLVGEPNSNTHE